MRPLRWGDDLESLGEVTLTMWILKSKDPFPDSLSWGDVSMRRPPPTFAGFEDGWKNVEGVRNCEIQGNGFSLDLPKVMQFGGDLDFTSLGLGTSYRTERWEIYMLFNPLRLWQTATTIIKRAMNTCHALAGFLGSYTLAVWCKTLPHWPMALGLSPGDELWPLVKIQLKCQPLGSSFIPMVPTTSVISLSHS